ncbi:YvzF family protein [Bacillus velezensis]|uniref:YvzF family protein n=1 Tax=Bacillus TaxID=1386 RepID=UPI0020A76576|nr:YvzF family protein [Bacillus velezensis]USY32178.1 YvzF family protein [Bacillus velezensis]WRT03802.1 YvzF family protein [Bacillus velezensis]WRT10649.1 YvzF family protein [Bacillus velezensis]
MAQVRLAGNAEEIEQLIKSFEAHYEVSYTSKEYRKTNPKYKYSKDSRVYLELKLKTAKAEK